MKLTTLVILFFASCLSLAAQTSTEVYLFDLSSEKGIYTISNPVNISNNPGYDNQPSFLPDGSAILFSSQRGDQMDIAQYNIDSKQTKVLTSSEGSEFSPTVDPSGIYFSTIILEKDGRQLLWKYPLKGGTPKVVVPEAKIGYHSWLNDHSVVAFVLGEPATLQFFELNEGKSHTLANNIGRSIHKIPGSEAISYIDKSKDVWVIKSIDPISAKQTVLAQTLEKSEDMAWSQEGVIFMGKEDKLYQFTPGKSSEWVEIAALKQYEMKNISRLSVSPNSNKIVIVVDQ